MQCYFTNEGLLNEPEARKKIKSKPSETPSTGNPEIEPIDPEEPIISYEDHEIIPEEDLDETPPYEPPSAGEGP